MLLNTKDVEEFCRRGAEMINEYQAKAHPSLPYTTVLYPDYGKKRVRIVRAEMYPGNDKPQAGSAWAFLDAEGNVYKSASWAMPAKHARANIYTDENMGFGEKIGPYGPAYLK